MLLAVSEAQSLFTLGLLILHNPCVPIYMSGKFLTVPMHIEGQSLKKETTQKKQKKTKKKRAFYCCLVWASKVVLSPHETTPIRSQAMQSIQVVIL